MPNKQDYDADEYDYHEEMSVNKMIPNRIFSEKIQKSTQTYILHMIWFVHYVDTLTSVCISTFFKQQ